MIRHRFHRNNIKESIIKTLAYASVFEYPLSMDELHKWLISMEKAEKVAIEKAVFEMDGIVKTVGDVVFLRGFENTVNKKKERRQNSFSKHKLASNAASYIARIPTVKLIGISGSLSMNNTDRNDDIDLFIIVKKNTLWMSRFGIFCLLSLLKKRRKAGDVFARDKICVNMIIDETQMTSFQKEKNIYIAHEIAQLTVLYQKDMQYQKFISQNSWIYQYLPNLLRISEPVTDKKRTFESIFSPVYFIFDAAFYVIQRKYMKEITKERVYRNFAAFHPNDKKEYVIALYKLRYKKFLHLSKIEAEGRKNDSVYKPLVTPGY